MNSDPIDAAPALPALNRRRWLKVSSLGWLGAGLPAQFKHGPALADERPTRPRRSPIKSVIVVFHYGGPSHLETYDPKPLAPAEARGEYQSITTAVPGITVGEHLPRVAKIMDRLALVRSMHHPMRNHNAAAAEALTGRTPVSGDLELLADESRSYPTLGSSVNFALGSAAHVLPYVALPYTIYNIVELPGQAPGFLGGQYNRFQVTGNPNAADFRISALEQPANRQSSELVSRKQLLHNLISCPRRGRSRKCEPIRNGPCNSFPQTVSAKASTSVKKTPNCATGTGGTCWVKACCSRAGSWKVASISSPSSMVSGTGRMPIGTVIRRSSRGTGS